jgi:DNA invertase Pin-like site-specific DNA recombinase
MTDISKSQEEKKVVYLYSRCSSIAQADSGESIQRQVEQTTAWVTRMFPTYDISTRSFILAAVSGFSGESIDLGGFFKSCESGEIVYGKSAIAFEALDRLGRLEPSKMRDILNRLKGYGVDIIVTKLGICFRYDEEFSLSSDLLITAGIHLARMESAQKSERIKHTVATRRELSRQGNFKRTAVAPSWLVLNDERTEFKLIPERVDLIKRIFNMKLNQDLGADAIARILTREKIETFGRAKEWSRTVLRRYLTNPAVIGRFQPQTVTKVDGKRVYTNEGSPIDNYYPAVISEDTFLATQATFKKAKAGRKGNFTNLFSGLTKCANCGSTMGVKQGMRKSGNRTYLRCSKANFTDSCVSAQIAYEPIESTLVSVLAIMDYSKLVAGVSTKPIEIELDALRVKRDAIDHKIAIELDNASLAATSIRARIMDRVNSLDEELSSIERDIANKQAELQTAASYSIDINLKIDDYNSRQAFNKFTSNYIEFIKPSKDSMSIKFKNKFMQANVKYGAKASEVVEIIYKTSDEEMREAFNSNNTKRNT